MAEELKAEDLRIDTYHAGEHSGFLHTNQTAVRITHLPTGVFVESKDERSVHANKQRCLDLLPEAIASMNTRAQLPSQGGGAVAWAICKEPGRVDWLSATYANKRAAEEHVAGYKDGLTLYITPLYAHPADQVAEGDAELVELLRNKFPRIDPCKPVPLDEKAHCCEYTIYVERERLHRLIDAKLASLKP